MDSTDAWLAGVNSGANIMSDRLNRNLRLQELRSQQALRQLQEKHLAQQMEIELQEHENKVKARAETEIAMNRAQWESSPFIMTSNPLNPTGPVLPIPNPKAKSKAQAMMDNLLPVAAKYGGPDAATKVMQAASLTAWRESQVESKALLLPSQIDLNEARTTDELEQARLRGLPKPISSFEQNRLKSQAALNEARSAGVASQIEDREAQLPSKIELSEARANAAEAQAALNKAKATGIPSQIKLAEARALESQARVEGIVSQSDLAQARIAEINAKIAAGKSGAKGVDPVWVREIEFMEQRLGKKYSPEEVAELWKIHTGVTGKAGAIKPTRTRKEYIDLRLPEAIRRDARNFQDRPQVEIIAELSKEYDMIYGKGATNESQAPEDGTEEETPEIIVQDPNGKRFKSKTGRVPPGWKRVE